MTDERLFIANYGSTGLKTIVKPQSGNSFNVTVGPKSFVTVSTQQVTGALPWQVIGSTGDGPTVDSLPAIVAFDPNVLTAVAYPTRPFIAYWIGEEPTGPGKSPTLLDIPAALVDSLDLIIINYVLVNDDGTLDFSVVTKFNTQATITGWITKIRERQENLARKTKFSLGILSDKFYSQDPKTFAANVAKAAKSWKMDGIDIDYEPPRTDGGIIPVIKAIKSALPGFLMTTPIYDAWHNNPQLKPYTDLFDYVTTMDYTPYQSYISTITDFERYATAMGGGAAYGRLAIGVSCMLFSDLHDYTPLEDVKKLCVYKPDHGIKPGMMLYTLSYDTPGHAGGNYPYKEFTYTETIAKILRES